MLLALVTKMLELCGAGDLASVQVWIVRHGETAEGLPHDDGFARQGQNVC
jgi:hypothetical protein